MIESTRALSSPTPREKQRLAGGTSRVYAGWLFVEANNKRAFAWRFCVLDGVCFHVYTCEFRLADLHTPRVKTTLVRQHSIVHVERIHRLNRGMLLIDRNGYGLWVHGTHEDLYFEQWLAILREGVQRQPVRLTISRYGFERQSSSCMREEGVAFTGWLAIRRRLLHGWLLGRARRMYCVLSGRHFSVFRLNMESRWADIHGKIKQFSLAKNPNWLELVLDNGTTLYVAAKSAEVTSVWELRFEAALRREPSQRNALLLPTKMAPVPRRTLTC